jgi:pimeloyl-ACP methyl ester carboxylesterase
MPQVEANGIALEYDEQGAADAPPILLIHGLGAQMTLWPDELIDALVARGFRVIRFDNRDIGLSEKMEGAKAPGILKMVIWIKLGLTIKSPYTLSDMAADAAGLLDALGIDKAHVVGASMGGMIAQRVALEHPGRVLSLTSIMSTTGSSKVPPAKKEALNVLTQRPKSQDKDTVVAHGVKILRTIEGRGFPQPEQRYLEQATSDFERSFYPPGMPRQLAAIMADGDRTKDLEKITAPTLVLHGEDDPLVRCEGGHVTAACIPGATLKTYPGMGHDFPLELIDEIADDIAGHAKASA